MSVFSPSRIELPGLQPIFPNSIFFSTNFVWIPPVEKVGIPRLLAATRAFVKMSRTKSLRLTVQSGSAFVDGLEGLGKNVQFGNQLAIKTKKDIDQQVKHGQALKNSNK